MQTIERDPLACDVLISLFTSALMSYRSDSLIRPFPKPFMTEAGERDVARLKTTAEGLPTVSELQHPSAAEEALLGWLLKPRGQMVVSRSPTLYESIQGVTGTSSYKVKPDCIVQLLEIDDGESTSAFEKLKAMHGSIIGYHGTGLENVHSILRNGFLNHFNTTALYGEGTYLSTDLSVAVGFCSSGKAWNRSKLGNKLSCVIVCEIIKHPGVRLPGTRAKPDVDRASTIGGEHVPESYIIVENNDLVRPKYLFIYVDHTARKSATPLSTVARGTGRESYCGQLTTYVRQNAFMLFMLLWFCGLCLVGVWKNRNHPIWRWWHKLNFE